MRTLETTEQFFFLLWQNLALRVSTDTIVHHSQIVLKFEIVKKQFFLFALFARYFRKCRKYCKAQSPSGLLIKVHRYSLRWQLLYLHLMNIFKLNFSFSQLQFCSIVCLQRCFIVFILILRTRQGISMTMLVSWYQKLLYNYNNS